MVKETANHTFERWLRRQAFFRGNELFLTHSIPTCFGLHYREFLSLLDDMFVKVNEHLFYLLFCNYCYRPNFSEGICFVEQTATLCESEKLSRPPILLTFRKTLRSKVIVETGKIGINWKTKRVKEHHPPAQFIWSSATDSQVRTGTSPERGVSITICQSICRN